MGLLETANSKRRWLADAVRERLWPVPVAARAVALALGAGLPVLDAWLDGYGWFTVSGRLLGGGPEAGRTILEVVAAALITVTSLTFSLTVLGNAGEQIRWRTHRPAEAPDVGSTGGTAKGR